MTLSYTAAKCDLRHSRGIDIWVTGDGRESHAVEGLPSGRK